MKPMSYLAGMFILAETFGTESASARWATSADAVAAVEFRKEVVTVKKDGTFQDLIEEQIEILKESGRDHYATQRLTYNSRASTLRIIGAETITQQERVPVDLKFIEDKPLASERQGFDQMNQVMVAFPQITVGSKTFLRYLRETTEVPLKDFFSRRLTFRRSEILRSRHIEFRSEVPLFYEVNDPGKVLTIRSRRDEDLYVLSIETKKEILAQESDESDPYPDWSEATWVVVSTAKSFAEVTRSIAETYEERLTEKLPLVFENIAVDALKKEILTDRINHVTLALSQAVRYMGDWRPIRGGNIPRPLSTIATTQFGDCKDFALVTAAILRRIGIEAHLAWVERGEKSTPVPTLPLNNSFNHAIVRLRSEGQILWIDPTNTVSFAQGIFPDISGRKALVLRPDGSLLEDIPLGTPEDSLGHREIDYLFQESGNVRMTGEFRLEGRQAIAWTGVYSFFSKDSLDRVVVTTFASESKVTSKQITYGYDPAIKVVDQASCKFDISQEKTIWKTTAGLGVPLAEPNRVSSIVDLATKDRVSGFWLGNPEKDVYLRRFLGIQLMGEPPRSCEVASRWLTVSRQVSLIGNDLIIKDESISTVTHITNAELKSSEFREFQTRLKDCFDGVMIIFNPVRSNEKASLTFNPGPLLLKAGGEI